MKARPRFHHGIIMAAVLAFVASVLFVGLAPFIGVGSIVRIAAPVLALAYLLFFFRSTKARMGRVVTLTAWAIMAPNRRGCVSTGDHWVPKSSE